MVRTPRSLATLTWAATSVVLMLALDPAVAPAKSINRSGRVPAARAPQGASHTAVAPNNHNSTPAGDRSGRRGRAHAESLAFGSGYASAHGSGAVRALQRRLAGLGYSPGPIDGRYGPLTDHAVRLFQATHGLLVDGVDGPNTRAGLASARLVLGPGAGYRPGGSGPVRALQRHLAGAGFSPGPIDGHYGPRTERAVRRFQAARHLHVDGVAGPQTLGRLGRHSQRSANQGSRPHGGARHRLPRRPPHVPAHQRRPTTSHPGGGSLAPWLTGLGCLMVVTLLGLLWHGRRRRDGAMPAGADKPSDPVPESIAAPVSAPPEPLPEPDLPDDPGRGAGVFRLAQALSRAGRPAPAADALRRADRLGHPEAAFRLGVLLLQAGDTAGAEDAFRRADERGHPGAAANLGVLLEQRGEVAAGRAAYERADERGEAVGAYNLGLLLEQEGDLERARAAFQRAADRGEPEGELWLGRLLEREGDHEGARRAFQRAGQLGPPEVAEYAHAALRELQADPDHPER